MGGDGDAYAGLISEMVQRNMLIDNTMFGKEAILRVNIAPDGLVLSIGSCDGNQAICSAGIAAVNRIGKFPAPPKDKYDEYKVLALNLKPGAQ